MYSDIAKTYKIVYTTKMKKDVKLLHKQGKDLNKLIEVLNKLAKKEKLPEKNKVFSDMLLRFIFSYCLFSIKPSCHYNSSMGLYVNPGSEKFSIATRSEIYVDKTMLLSELNRRLGTEDRFLAVSRPRRFGKTMAESMMAAYYSKGCDSAGLFKGLKIAGDPGFRKHLNKYNVLHLDINRFWSSYDKDALKRMRLSVLKEFREEFPDVGFDDDSDIADCIITAYKSTRIPFVVILDEYDVIFRGAKACCIEEDYLRFLNALFKGSDVAYCIALAYITGILPIIREKAQSKLNNFKEVTFLRPGRFLEFTGFTSEEVRSLCERYGMDYDECRSWYDGYEMKGMELYSPKSVTEAMMDCEYRSYWNQTSQYEAILEHIRYDMEGIREDIETMMAGGSVPVNITLFQNTPQKIRCKDDVFTYLCHLGYLSYDSEAETCRIPNREVRMEWVNAITINGEHQELLKMINGSKEVLDSAWHGDAPRLAKALEAAHQKLTSNLSYNNEQSLQSAIRLAFFCVDCCYIIVMEYPAGKGYADIAFIPYKPNIPAMLVELKVRETAGTALDQIREKRYFAGLDKFKGNTLLIGVSYDRSTKAHECKIERV